MSMFYFHKNTTVIYYNSVNSKLIFNLLRKVQIKCKMLITLPKLQKLCGTKNKEIKIDKQGSKYICKAQENVTKC